MRRLFAARLCLQMLLLLLLCAGTVFNRTVLAQAKPEAIVGTWIGRATLNDESKPYAARFEIDKQNRLLLFFYIPDMKMHGMGPFSLKTEGSDYKNQYFTFRLSPDEKRLTGMMSFDGHDLRLELERGALPAPPASQPLGGRIAKPAWTFKTGDAIWSSPALAGNTIYFGNSGGNIYALNASSGKLDWQYKTGGRVMGRPTVEGSNLYALSDDGNLYKLQVKSGKLVWKFDTRGGALSRDLPGPKSETYDYLASAATVQGATVYIGSADKKLYAVDVETGREKWHFDTQGIVRSTPAVAAGLVFIGSYDNHVYAVDAGTGTLKWKFDTLQPVVSSPLIANGTVYIGSRSSDLFALDAATGKVKWKYFYWSSWVESSARLHKGVLYVGSSDYQQLLAIDAATGKHIWNTGTDGSSWSTPAVTDKMVYIGVVGVTPYFIEHHGGFLAVDRATGNILWRFPMSAIPGVVDYGVASSPAVDDKMVFFGGLDGTFYAFRTEG
jgi:eukaryotic-like serine/threonine-protein kinase